MAYLPISAFSQPMTHVQIQRAHQVECQSFDRLCVDKWEVFRALAKAQASFGVSERDLSLLQGLLSFYPNDQIRADQKAVIFPSNRSICERMNGMADSTMRRHLRNLIAAGLLLRRDSNNGKRFALKEAAFGFDLSPLLHLSEKIFEAAQHVMANEQQLKQLRLEVNLMRRDLFAMIPLLTAERAAEAQNYWHEGSKLLRRKLILDEMQALHAEHQTLINALRSMILNSSDVQNEQHKQDSNIKYLESDSAVEIIEAETTDQMLLPLDLVTKACPMIEDFYSSKITHWSHLIDAANRFYPSIGITKHGYDEATSHFGVHQTAIIIAAILQRFEQIKSPGAYLRALVRKYNEGTFSYKPMIMALLTAK